MGKVVEFPAGERGTRTEKISEWVSPGKVVEFPGGTRAEKISEWVCPVCGQELNLSEFKSQRGFLLVCKGSDGIPHRLRIYLENFRKDASFLPAPSSSKKTRLAQMLDRVKEA